MSKKLSVGLISLIILVSVGLPSSVRADNRTQDFASSDVFQVTELIVDGGFEACNPVNQPDACPDWNENPILDKVVCNALVCGLGGGTAGPRTGNNWVWLGGNFSLAGGSVEQGVIIPAGGTATFSFYWWVGTSPSVASDYFEVSVDKDNLFSVVGTALSSGPQSTGYVQVTIDVSAYADGGLHYIIFHGASGNGNVTNINLDDISLTYSPAAPLYVPHITDILIYSWEQVVAYGSPGGEPARLSNGAVIVLPQDYDGNGFDTYVVTDSTVIDGETWVSIFLGNESFAWVQLSQVHLAGPQP